MTDTSSVFATYPASPLNPVTASSLASPIVNGSLSDTVPNEDDEPYTIKCICAFQDDDGNTVFCEKCETWQHIDCYYHGKNVPDIHNCADCEPRPMDVKRATERQRRLREQTDGGDRKAKRASSKSHKKKVKDTEQTNGWHHERHESVSASRDQPPPAKRPKTSHRPSGSVSSVNGTSGQTTESRKRAHSTAQSYPSPTKSPLSQNGPIFPQYTTEFLHLYDDDQGKSNLSMRDNFNTINVTGKLKLWSQDPMALSLDTNGKPSQDIFIRSDAPLDSSSFPPVSLHTITNQEIEIDGRHPSWQILRLEQDVHRDDLVGEIKGSIGELTEYCRDENNRWSELLHPEPFVFFHPHLPIYIDSRREGTKFRYLRRSCRPNVTMKTYIDSEGEYHYCFVAKDDIPAGTELTTTWYLDPALTNHMHIKEEIPTDGDNDLPALWASRVLANFGDCACDSIQQPCMLAPLDRRRRSNDSNIKQSIGKRKKTTKNKHISPPATGRGSTSRAGSETVKGADDDDQFETRSTSGSVRSKPRSRDLTPTNAAESSNLGAVLTDREKRKIAAAEKTFERLEQDQQEKKKKKRPSGGSATTTPGISTSKQLGNPIQSQPGSPLATNQTASSYVDAGTSRPFSASPPSLSTTIRKHSATIPKISSSNAPSLPSPLGRPTYVDAEVQTDDDEIILVESPPNKRRKFTPLTQRLLKRCYEDRMKYEEIEQKRASFSAGNTLPSPISPSANSDSSALPVSIPKEEPEDTEMKDSASSVIAPSSPLEMSSPTTVKSVGTVESPEFAPPLPSQAAHTRKSLPPPNGFRLHLPQTPLVPGFSNGGGAGTPTSQLSSPLAMTSASSYVGINMPTGTTGSISSSLTAPSPVKKKLSLGDYMSRRNATPSTEKSAAQLQMPIPSSALDLSMDDGKASESLSNGISIAHSNAADNDSIKAESSLNTGPATLEVDVPMKEMVADAVEASALLEDSTVVVMPSPDTQNRNRQTDQTESSRASESSVA